MKAHKNFTLPDTKTVTFILHVNLQPRKVLLHHFYLTEFSIGSPQLLSFFPALRNTNFNLCESPQRAVHSQRLEDVTFMLHVKLRPRKVHLHLHFFYPAELSMEPSQLNSFFPAFSKHKLQPLWKPTRTFHSQRLEDVTFIVHVKLQPRKVHLHLFYLTELSM